MSGRVEEIRKNGLHTFKNNSHFFGFSVNKPAVCNIVIKQLPTSILKDFSGNKHDAYLYGFKGKLNSGVGIYAQDFKNWNYGSTINKDISTKSYNKFHIVKKADKYFGFTIGIPKNNYYNQSYKLKFNINKKIDDIKFNIVSTDGNLITTAVYSVYINDGSIIDVPIISEKIFNNKEETNIYYDFGTNEDIEIDVELIANYPNQLCYDGKSYAITYVLPILTDYTVIADRTWFAEKVDNGVFMSKALEQNGAFILEYKQGDRWNTYSYYSATNINIDKDNSIVYQTKNKYNEQTIYPGDKQDTDTLFIGTIRKDDLINSYILIFKKDKVTEQVYKTYIRVTKELLNSIYDVNDLLIELTYTGSIGSKWEEFDDELLYKPYIRTKGTFAQKPLSSQGIQQGFSYFCTDKQTVEGSRSGIMIYYAGNDTWVDALGRYV